MASLYVRQGEIVFECIPYDTPEEATPVVNGGSCWPVKDAGVIKYIGLWPISESNGNNHSPLQINQDGITYWVETEVTSGKPVFFNLQDFSERAGFYANWNYPTHLSWYWDWDEDSGLEGITIAPNASHAFDCAFGIQDFDGLEQTWNTSYVTDMSYMLSHLMIRQPLDCSNWNTSNVTNMEEMFYCYNFFNLYFVRDWNVSSVVNMKGMFEMADCFPTIPVEKWDVSSVEDISNMFLETHYMTVLDVSNWNTSNIKDMSGAFSYCGDYIYDNEWTADSFPEGYPLVTHCGLESLDLSRWDTHNAVDMTAMFSGCGAKIIDVSNFDTTNVANGNTSGMFYHDCDPWYSDEYDTWDLEYIIIGSPVFKFQMRDSSCGDIPENTKILVPSALLSTYRTAENWSNIANQFEAIENYIITRANGQVTVTPNTIL